MLGPSFVGHHKICPGGDSKVETISSDLKASPDADHMQQYVLLWMDKILDHLRNPGMMIQLQIPTNNGFNHASKAVQDFAHPQYPGLTHPNMKLSVSKTKLSESVAIEIRLPKRTWDIW